jgi:hypothetical protein
MRRRPALGAFLLVGAGGAFHQPPPASANWGGIGGWNTLFVEGGGRLAEGVVEGSFSDLDQPRAAV